MFWVCFIPWRSTGLLCSIQQFFNPFFPTVPTCAPLKPLRDDSVLRALSSLRGLRGALPRAVCHFAVREQCVTSGSLVPKNQGGSGPNISQNWISWLEINSQTPKNTIVSPKFRITQNTKIVLKRPILHLMHTYICY